MTTQADVLVASDYVVCATLRKIADVFNVELLWERVRGGPEGIFLMEALKRHPRAARGRLRKETRYSHIIIQCIRNAIVHGIETPTLRQAAGKAARGLLSIRLSMDEAGKGILECRDDGQGIDVETIRETLMQSGRYNVETLKNCSQQEIIGEIFNSGISTAEEVRPAAPMS